MAKDLPVLANNLVTSETVWLLTPEIWLIVAASLVYVGGAFVRNRNLWAGVSLAILAIAGALLVTTSFPLLGNFHAGNITPTGPVSIDALGHSMRWMSLLVGAMFICVTWQTASSELAPEQLGSTLLVMTGVMLSGVANELTLVFLSLELISIPIYMLLFVGKRDRDSAEATAKYFFLSIMSSACLLYGFSFLYGMGKSTYLPDIRATLANFASNDSNDWQVPLMPVALTLTLIGLGFKMAFVPFHFYAPDVYQGTTNSNAALLAIAPKAAGAIVLMRLLSTIIPADGEFLWRAMVVLSIVTMTIGNVSALWQKNVRRMLAFSSIAHSGYMLMGIAVVSAPFASEKGIVGGATGVVFYILLYSFSTLGAFAVLASMSTRDREVGGLDELAGLARIQPGLASVLAIFMFSLAGIPPLAGFWGKLSLFYSAIVIGIGEPGPTGVWFVAMAVFGAINAAIGAAYYLRVVGTMYFQPVDNRRPAGALDPGVGGVMAAAACAIVVLGISAVPGIGWRPSERAGKALAKPMRIEKQSDITLKQGDPASSGSVAVTSP
jgi:NADH-quinone oxidoreductase subunit N